MNGPAGSFLRSPDGLADEGPTVLEPGAIDRLRELDPGGRSGFLVRVMASYRDSLVETRTQIAAAARAGDWQAVGEAVHKIKSSSQNVGAEELARRCLVFESLRRESRLAEMPAAASALSVEIDRVWLAAAPFAAGGRA